MVDQPLPSWAVGPAREAILDFVSAVVSRSVAVEDRVAVFDNDGTLWTEKPMPTQLHHMVRAWAAAAKADPEHGFTVVSVRDDWSDVFASGTA